MKLCSFTQDIKTISNSHGGAGMQQQQQQQAAAKD
jgi:hypothetical protein